MMLEAILRGGPGDGKPIHHAPGLRSGSVEIQFPVYKQEGQYCSLAIMPCLYRCSGETDEIGRLVFEYASEERLRKEAECFGLVLDRLETLVSMNLAIDFAVRLRDENIRADYRRSKSR